MLNGRNFVAGEWRDGADWVEDLNPSDVTDIVGRFAQARPSDIHDAVAAAQGAQREWAAAGLE
ncbi:MAG: aldehyde dehydrogenase family protein, partial [Mesorhizobium sp.]